MHTSSFTQFVALALLATPLVSALPLAPSELERKSISGTLSSVIARTVEWMPLEVRHHTEAQIAAKKAKAKAGKRDAVQDQQDFEDVFGLEGRSPHHTEAQIAAKKAKAAKSKAGKRDAIEDLEDAEDALAARSPHHTEAQIAAKKAKAAKAKAGKREAHHTEAQIAAKKAKAAKTARDVEIETREPHHTEAQIAAKKAKAAKAS